MMPVRVIYDIEADRHDRVNAAAGYAGKEVLENEFKGHALLWRL